MTPSRGGRLPPSAAWESGALVLGAAIVVAVEFVTVGLAPAMGVTALSVLMAIWGAAHAAAFVICQVRVTRVAAGIPRLAAALNISAANVGIALGSAAGGWALAEGGLDMLGWVAFGIGLLSLGLAAGIGYRGRRRHVASTGSRSCQSPCPTR